MEEFCPPFSSLPTLTVTSSLLGSDCPAVVLVVAVGWVLRIGVVTSPSQAAHTTHSPTTCTPSTRLGPVHTPLYRSHVKELTSCFSSWQNGLPCVNVVHWAKKTQGILRSTQHDQTLSISTYFLNPRKLPCTVDSYFLLTKAITRTSSLRESRLASYNLYMVVINLLPTYRHCVWWLSLIIL